MAERAASTSESRRPVTASGGVTLTDADRRQAGKLEHVGTCQGGTVTTFRFADRPEYQVVRCPNCGAMNEERRD